MDGLSEFAHFLDAQALAMDQVFDELIAGQKRSHWMWFIFPQLQGLGRSPMSLRYSMKSLEHAQAYLQVPLLRTRLIECCRLLIRHKPPIENILGDIDALKLSSSMTLFELADPSQPIFKEVLEYFFDGERDKLTLEKLNL